MITKAFLGGLGWEWISSVVDGLNMYEKDNYLLSVDMREEFPVLYFMFKDPIKEYGRKRFGSSFQPNGFKSVMICKDRDDIIIIEKLLNIK